MKEIRNDLIEIDNIELYPIPSFKRFYVNLEDGKVYDTLKERYLVANPNSNGYCYGSMTDDFGDYKSFSIHVIVMMAFMYLPAPIWVNSKLEIHHIDNDKSNNSLLNLQLVTRQKQYECTITKRSLANRSTKRIKLDDVIRIKLDLLNWTDSAPEFCRKWSKELDVAYRSIHNILSGQTYSKIEVE